MDGQPVALQGGDEGADIAFCTWHQRSEGNSDSSQRRGDNANRPLVISDIHDEVHQDNGPGKEYKGFIYIGKGYISVTGGITFPPADQQAREVKEKTNEDNYKSNRAHRPRFCCYKQQVKQKGDNINKHGAVKEVRVIHAEFSLEFRGY